MNFASFFLIFVSLTVTVYSETVVLSAIDGTERSTEITIQILTEAYRRIGYLVEIKKYPAGRALIVANDGEVDGELARIEGIDLEYKNLIRVPVLIHTNELCVFTMDTSMKISTWSDLKPYIVGYRFGLKNIETSLPVEVQKYGVSHLDQAFQMLSFHRVDAVLAPMEAGMETIKKLGLNGIIRIPKPLSSNRLYHYLHIKNTHLLGPLTETLQKMTEDGTIRRLSTP